MTRIGAALVLVWLLVMAPVHGADLLSSDTAASQAIDHYIDARLKQRGITPAASARDETVVRRTTLDLAGRPATVTEVQQYLADDRNDKRERLISRLLDSEEFVQHQSTELNAFLMKQGNIRPYLEPAIRENRPWDVIFRELILAKEKESGEFLKTRANDLDKLTNETSVIFFGVNISCARCHDHPEVPEWTQDRYFGMKSFFSRTFVHGDFVGEREYGQVDFKTTEGDSRKARLMFFTGVVLEEPEAKEPDDKQKKEDTKRLDELKKKKQPPPVPQFSRREQLINVALVPDNQPYLARAIVNHQWKRFLGRGLVHPVDQMHPENLPSHPDLLEWLARDLLEHQFDLRRLVGALVSSNAYARDSRWTSNTQRPEEDLFAVAMLRPLSPQQYATTLRMGSTDPEQFQVEGEERAKRIEQLHNAARGLADKFELPRDDFQISVTEALLMSNSEQIERELLRDSNDSLVHRLTQLETAAERAETAIWTVLGHAPEEQQLKSVTEYFEKRQDRPLQAAQQVVWALLCASPCRFNY